jgi:tRNA (cytidine/uridine-2'-O-)-methyltransferase
MLTQISYQPALLFGYVMLRIALYQPDIPQNAGTLVRLAVCLGLAVDIIEPAAFDASDRNFRRAGMDYIERATVLRHVSWSAFQDWQTAQGGRLILAETDGQFSFTEFMFQPNDIILMGRESAGVPSTIRADCTASVRIPQIAGSRSINVALAAAMIVSEALRQTRGFASDDST